MKAPWESYPFHIDGKKKINAFWQECHVFSVFPFRCCNDTEWTFGEVVEPFAVSAKTGQLWDMRFLRAMGIGGGSPSLGKRQPFPPRPKWEHELQGRKQRQ